MSKADKMFEKLSYRKEGSNLMGIDNRIRFIKDNKKNIDYVRKKIIEDLGLKEESYEQELDFLSEDLVLDLLYKEITVENKHLYSVFYNEQELLQGIIDIHLNGKDIELDPMYFKGNFYKDEINRPKYIFDRRKTTDDVVIGDAKDLPFEDCSFDNMILDPPFLFEIRKRKQNNYSALTHTILYGFEELEELYKGIIKESHRILKKNGVLIFKCQDYTDSKTTLTHTFVQKWAEEQGFYTKDLAILVKENKIYNSKTRQRHFRKVHTYFFVFVKKNNR